MIPEPDLGRVCSQERSLCNSLMSLPKLDVLSPPKEKRQQIFERKAQIVRLRQVKNEKVELKRKGKLLSAAWRNGVVGQNVLANEDKAFEARASLRADCKLKSR